MNISDITQNLISEKTVRNNLLSLFPESVLLKDDFIITAINNNLTALLGYDETELVGVSIRHLIGSENQFDKFNEALMKGYFNNLTLSFCGKGNEKIPCTVYGFYLGLIGDLNGILVLTVKPIDETVLLYNELEKSRNELDDFIYRASHDLRGPLASLRGLINLLKMHVHEREPAQLIDMMNTCAEQMDHRLFNLHYLSEPHPTNAADYTLDCSILETSLRATIEENMPIDGIGFQFISEHSLVEGINSQRVIALLNHLLLYLISLPKNASSALIYTVSSNQKEAIIVIRAEGFLSNYQLQQAVKRKSPFYTNVITYSNLINYYAAQKIAHTLHAMIDIEFIQPDIQQVSICIPVD
jgi:signal transduction histidine kinase